MPSGGRGDPVGAHQEIAIYRPAVCEVECHPTGSLVETDHLGVEVIAAGIE